MFLFILFAAFFLKTQEFSLIWRIINLMMLFIIILIIRIDKNELN